MQTTKFWEHFEIRTMGIGSGFKTGQCLKRKMFTNLFLFNVLPILNRWIDFGAKWENLCQFLTLFIFIAVFRDGYVHSTQHTVWGTLPCFKNKIFNYFDGVQIFENIYEIVKYCLIIHGKIKISLFWHTMFKKSCTSQSIYLN